ncbi:ribosomal protection-like ABC-F family protein [Lacrimispora celerecrescens]|uniref:ATPase subunit of ABC transporter with duplicated ATPase domains n=1 Tax=[Clostridium] celerecrescens 18A TaxID=1286362 RepID=A0A2M8Z130_9FIRM|nr:ABC-F family ATP-binding cassette domain-containing protein [Lacrimispora celerecrescens]PJJ27168.1 ATPase subunit of ABC transporter with duplicated ATPase domains [[Clostridium] celerecrescens 18A]
MIELSINNLTKFYGANKIFETICFEVKTGERIGLIGKNGCGKTTIMKIIMGRFKESNLNLQGWFEDTGQVQDGEASYGEEVSEDYQAGEVNLRKGIKVGYLNQIPVYSEDTKAIDVIRMAFQKVFDLKRRLSELEGVFQTSSGEKLEKALLSYGRLTEEYEIAGGYELETKINKITEGLKINDILKQLPFQSLSGGEKTRVILAKILLEEPDILLLDEPTNHLDLETTEWLEGFLKDYKGSVLIISHDRYFLDNVAMKIVELEFSRANIYMGNYSYYVLEKERRFLIDYRNYINQQKKIEQMEKQIERYRIWGNMRDSETMFKRAKELEKRLEKIEVLDKPVLEGRKVRLNQDSTNRSGKMVLETKHLSKSFGDTVLLKDIDMKVYYQDSACIIGKNGCGKSTLLKLILGELKPDYGTVKIGAQVKIGYLPQQVVFEDENQTILEYFSGLHNITYEAARNQLARVLFFKDDVHKKIRFLSGGEKSRLRLCSLTFEKVNFMILDEPTNHLDIDSREVLEETLTAFEGTLLFVSHDRYFINKVAGKIMSFENNHLITYPGDYTYYQEELQKAGKFEDQSNEKARGLSNLLKVYEDDKPYNKEQPQKPYEKRPSIGVEVNQYSRTDNKSRKLNTQKSDILVNEIEAIEAALKALEQEINNNNSNFEYLQELFLKKETMEKELDFAYDKWENCQ